MITELTTYRTSDNKLFYDRDAAVIHESLFEKCDKIMSKLRPHNGTGAVQQDIDTVKSCYNDFLDLCAFIIPNYKTWFHEVKVGIRHESHISRILSDYNSEYPFLWKSFFRFTCTSRVTGIEYYQPYYVNHEEEWTYGVK